MVLVRLLVGAALTSLATLGVHAPGSAQQRHGAVAADASSVEARERATHRALLDAFLARRAELERSKATPESKRAALDFLDDRIAQMRHLLKR